ncbi:MAG: DUF4147 domain-containing protein [Phycisphaeraceae bacterium]|nr:DUF4147 domain-containing protein [Phycisphaeraceae bacterium]
MIIRNRDQLLSNGHVRGRTLALNIIAQAMQQLDGVQLVNHAVRMEANVLRVGDRSYPLADIRDIYILGAGKGVAQLAAGLEQVLGERIRGGVVIEKYFGAMDTARANVRSLKRVEVLEAGHPIPDQAASDSARRLIRLAKQAQEGDLVFVCVQGGCSSLTTLPAEGLSLPDVQQATQCLLQSGADVQLLDALRTAITQLQGGQLAEHIHPARVVNLVVEDDIWRYPRGWDDPAAKDAGWGPSVPVKQDDYQRLRALADILKQRDLWAGLPKSVQRYLTTADPCRHALTADDFSRLGILWQTLILADPQTSAQAACQAARTLGLSATILATTLQGDAAQAGMFYAAIAKEIAKNSRPVAPPAALIVTGETTVRLDGAHGQGGPNQECVLTAAVHIDASPHIVIASVGTDGTDGPTDAAGGIVDGCTLARARQLGLDLVKEIKQHNATFALKTLGDAIYFTHPGTNLCDLSVILVTK